MSMADNQIKLTVFTPTYNRIHTLVRTYESLKNQTCKDFIWLIVDDGSTDGTSDAVRLWQTEERSFEIRYLYKPNGGMHTAHNTAYENINTELNVCIDSDDIMPSDAVEQILKCWDKIDQKRYAGIMGLNADMKGQVIGKGFPEGMAYSTVSGYYERGGKGDKKLVYRTDIIKKYPPYPVYEGEKYFSLSYKYLLCDQDYEMVVLPKVLSKVEYQDDGSTRNMFRQYFQNPNGFAEWRKIKMKYGKSWKRRVKDCIHYCSSCILCHKHGMVRDSNYPILTILCIPAGLLLSLYIRISLK